ncbi:MAG: GntR family transcriptional regulator, partial [Armatimonadota bacterium]
MKLTKRNRSSAVQFAIDSIRADIRSGRFAVNSVLPSECDVAESLELSRGTVRRAIEALVASGELNRKPHSRPTIASPQRTSSVVGNEIHVWISQPIANSVSMAFLQGLSAGLIGTKFRLVVREPIGHFGIEVVREQREFMRSLIDSENAVGAILEREPLTEDDDLFAEAIERGKHLVFVDVPAPHGLVADHVGTENA